MWRDANKESAGKRTKYLNRLFLDRLELMAEKLYEPFIASGAVRKEEVNDELSKYYTAKKSGLQVVYSYYAEQWDYFHRVCAAENAAFLSMLQQARSLFSRLYTPSELNLAYYTEQLSKFPVSHARWQLLRNHFMQKWERLLSAREEKYQREHIERLCDGYFRMVKEKTEVLQNKGKMGDVVAPRLAWLQMTQSPEMRDILRKLTPLLYKNRIITELNRILGRKHADESRLYQAVSGRTPLDMLCSSSHSDIVGIKEGNNLNALLPVEYCYLSDERLEDFFIRRYTENKLAVFDAVSRQRQSVEAASRRGKEVRKYHLKGPFVVCVDTSGSMKGEREIFAKAVVLSIALLSEHLDRLCRVILFSDQVEVIELRNLYRDLPLLENFLCRSFYGGSDMKCAMEEAVQTLLHEDFYYADMLWISDFEMVPMSSTTKVYIEELKQRGLRLYAVSVGERYEQSYLLMANRYWIQV